jgi:hypothetical protein
VSIDHPPATDWSRLLPSFTRTQTWHIFWKFITDRHYQSANAIKPKLLRLKERVKERIRWRIASMTNHQQREGFRQRKRLHHLDCKSVSVAKALQKMKRSH